MQNTNATDSKSRISLLLSRDLARDVTTLARINQDTTNNFICRILREVVDNNAEIINDYRNVMAKFKSKYRSNDGDEVPNEVDVDGAQVSAS